MKLKNKVIKALGDQTNVLLWYNIDRGGTTITTAGLYHLKEGKIAEFSILFDPRPQLK